MFRDKFGVKQHDNVLCKQQSLDLGLKKLFSNEHIIEEYFALYYRSDFTFKKHMLVVEINEKDNNERLPNYEKQRQDDPEKGGYKIISINPDKPDFDDYEEFDRVSSYIAKSIKNQTEELTKKLLIDDLSKRLLKLKFKADHSIRSKCLKWMVKKIM